MSLLYPFTVDDGGRAAAGFKGSTGDCATRAAAIALRLPYAEVYEQLADFCKTERASKVRRGTSHPRTGVHTITYSRWLKEEMGCIWHATMGIGTGCRVHICPGELPEDRRLILNLSRHFSTLIDGVIHDTYNPDRMGTRCVYGYWWQP
jgi:hypothetical protein